MLPVRGFPLKLTGYGKSMQGIYYGVVLHTGKVLTCSAVGPRFKPQQGQGIFRAHSVLD